MLYDQLLGLCERYAEELVPIVANARLFDFPHVPHEVLASSHTPESREFFNEFFALPFPLVAVEDQASVVVMWDDKHDQVGLSGRRQYIECVKFDDAHLAAFKEANEPKGGFSKAEKLAMKDLYAITSGSLNKVTLNEGGVNAEAQLINTLIVSKKEGVKMTLADFPKLAVKLIANSAARNAITAIEEFMVFNGPERFVVAVTPVRKQRKKPKKALRSTEKTIFVLKTPVEIREYIKPEPGEGTKAAHERRRHVRMYPDDEERWPNMHGKAKVIPACWIGPSEAVVRGKHYRVCLDL